MEKNKVEITGIDTNYLKRLSSKEGIIVIQSKSVNRLNYVTYK